MNFFSVGRLNEALYAVGNIIAPLPEDYNEENTQNILENNENDRKNEDNNNENDNSYNNNNNSYNNNERYEDRYDNYDENINIKDGKNIQIKENYNNNKNNLNNFNNGYNIYDNGNENKLIIDNDNDNVNVHDSNDNNLNVDNFNENSNQLDDLENKLNNEIQSIETESIESLQEQLKSYKSKVTAAFSEISSLSDNLREVIHQNLEYEKKLSEERSTQQLMSSRIESLLQSKEQLALQLSETLQTLENEKNLINEKEKERILERKKEQEAYVKMLEQYKLMGEEKARLTLQLAEIEGNIQNEKENLNHMLETHCLNEKEKIKNILSKITKLFIEIQYFTQSKNLEDKINTINLDHEVTYENITEYIESAVHILKESKKSSIDINDTLVNKEEKIHLLTKELYSENEKYYNLESEYKYLQTKLNEENEKIKELEMKMSNIVREKEEIFFNTNNKLKILEEQNKKFHEEVIHYQNHIKSLENSLEEFKISSTSNNQLLNSNDISQLHLIQTTNLTLQHEIQELQLKNQSLSFEIENYERNKHLLVQLFQQSIGIKIENSMSEIIQILTQNWTTLREKIKNLEFDREKHLNNIQKLNIENENFINQLKNLNHEKNELEKKVKELSHQLEENIQKLNLLTIQHSLIESNLFEQTERIKQQEVYFEKENKQLKEENELLKEQKNKLFEENTKLNQAGNQIAIDMKREMMKLETENRQLNQIVSQLRNARKTSQESADTALADKQTFIQTIENQKKELINLRDKLSNYDIIVEEHTQFRNEVNTLKDTLHLMRTDYEQRLNSITSLYQSTYRDLSDRERVIYEYEGKIEVYQSDLKVTKQDLLIRSKELENIHLAMNRMEKEYQINLKKVDENWNEKLKKFENEWNRKLQEEIETYQGKIEKIQQELKEKELQVEDEILLKRKLEIEMITEKKKLSTTLQHALNQLQNSQNDSVDRILIKNLIVRYFQQRRSMEVLSVISRVLNFSEDEKVIVGLQVPPGSIITSLFQTFANPILGIVPQPSLNHQSTPVEGENLAEMWLNYLIHESDEGLNTSDKLQSQQDAPFKENIESESKQLKNQELFNTTTPHRSYQFISSNKNQNEQGTSGLELWSSSISPSLSPSISSSSLSSKLLIKNQLSNISLPNSDSENENEVDGFRQAVPSPVLYSIELNRSFEDS